MIEPIAKLARNSANAKVMMDTLIHGPQASPGGAVAAYAELAGTSHGPALLAALSPLEALAAKALEHSAIRECFCPAERALLRNAAALLADVRRRLDTSNPIG